MSKANIRIGIATALAALAGSAALAAPVSVNPGDTGIAVPLYGGGPTPTVDVLADTGLQTLTVDSLTVQFEEVAVTTSLNPGGVSFGFAMAASNSPTGGFTATLPGFASFTTSVESCDPLASGAGVCGRQTGTVARSAGTGDVLTFSNIGTTAVTLPIIGTTFASNVYGVFTNASGFIDPTVTVMDDGTAFVFNGIAPQGGSTSVPEPGTLALLGFGLLGVLGSRRRRRAMP